MYFRAQLTCSRCPDTQAGSAARPTYLPISFAAEDALDEQGKEKFASAVQRRLAQFALQARAFSAFAEQTDRGDVSMDAAQDVSCQPPTLEATLTEVAAQDPALAAGAPLWLTGGKPPVPTQQPLPTTAAAAAESAGGVDADAAGAVPQQTGAAWDPLNVFRGRRIRCVLLFLPLLCFCAVSRQTPPTLRPLTRRAQPSRLPQRPHR